MKPVKHNKNHSFDEGALHGTIHIQFFHTDMMTERELFSPKVEQRRPQSSLFKLNLKQLAGENIIFDPGL